MGNQRQNIILGVRPGWATTEESFEPHNRTVRKEKEGNLCKASHPMCCVFNLFQDVIFKFLAAGFSKGLVDHVPAEKLLDPDEGEVQTWIGFEFVPSTIRPRLVKLS
ncbi:hypothetical protein OIU79_013709 [Salix purpurea]|uniref:Uncharacterized protein n=1 Tax=Salix purpurea TaxID=77065 RepID=A0A9Q0PPL3_SALPP|nr:hypothetical protein OIU79_013709 [Salix purpurea]